MSSKLPEKSPSASTKKPASKPTSKAPVKRSLWTRIKDAVDPDYALQLSMAAMIEAAAVKHVLGLDQERWAPGKPLKLLLAGYVGSRNTGADVRVEEMIRQFRHVVGDDQLELTIMTLDPKLTAGYFRTVRQVELPVVFPKFLFDECPKHHGVVSCEGSMFKSKFAAALSTMMAGALGMAAAENKLAVGYGAEAGAMSPALRDFVKKHCQHALVQCRNEPSRDVLGRLGIRTTGGADTAWTFDPLPLPEGAKILREHGWDGEKKLLVLCPINPFWWPVKPDVGKAAARALTGQFKREHYRSIYFHHSSVEADEKYARYVDGLAFAVASRPGGVLWPRLPGATLRIIISYTAAYTEEARQKTNGKLKIGWTTSYDDTSHSSLSSSGGRNYVSNAYGMQRKDWAA